MDWTCCLKTLAIFAIVIANAEAKCEEQPLLERGINIVYLDQEEKDAVAQCSDSSHLFQTGDLGFFVDCSVDEPVNSSFICAENTEPGNQCTDALTVPTNFFKIYAYMTMNNVGEKFYNLEVFKCSSPEKFLSNEKYKISQCKNGNMSPVYDLCSPACEVVQDCSDVASLGDFESDLYRIVPTGIEGDESIIASCEMDDPHGGGTGWTTVLQHYGSGITGKVDEFLNGIGADNLDAPDRTTYFIGIKHLHALSKVTLSSNRDLVVQFLLEDLKGNSYHATYGGLTIRDETYNLDYIGPYHGNAGDVFKHHSNQPWQCHDGGGGKCWWGAADGKEGVKIHSSNPYWNHWKLKYLHMRVRPTSFDSAEGCPPKFKVKNWPHTYVDLPLSRLPGTIIPYECTKDSFKASAMETEGNITCASYKQWDKDPNLPCKYVPPEDYILTPNGTSSLLGTNDEEGSTIMDAALKCAGNGASLAVIDTPNLELFMDIDVFYYTAHLFSNGSVKPPLPAFLKCIESCDQPSEEHPCIVVNSEASYNGVNCNDPYAYLCQHPAICPTGYSLNKGICYKIIESDGNLLNSLITCNEEGSSLAFPESLDVLDYLASLLQESFGPDLQEEHILIGLSNTSGALEGFSFYNPNDEIFTLATEVGSQHFSLNVSNHSYILTSAALGDNEANYAACQYFGQIECTWNAPKARDNMVSDWDGTTKTVGHEVTYTCSIGFFVDGVFDETMQTSRCRGQVGEWSYNFKECLPIELCKEPLPDLPSKLYNVTTNVMSRTMNGVTLINCPPNTKTRDGLDKQPITCTEESADVFAFQPTTIELCDVCTEALDVPMATTTYDSSMTWVFGDVVDVTCDENFHAYFESPDFQYNCTDAGWQAFTSCYSACTDPPPPAGEHIVLQEYDSDGIGAQVIYTCEEGYYLPLTTELPDVRSSVTLTCKIGKMNNVWADSNEAIGCIRLCADDPPVASGLISSTWDFFNRSVGTEVTYSCPNTLRFGDNTSSWIVPCRENGTWMPIVVEHFECKKPAPIPPPTPPFQATIQSNDEYFWVGSLINYTCGEAQMTPLGVTYLTISCGSTGWTPPLDPEFVCLNICASEMPYREFTSNNFTGYPYWGTVVMVYSWEDYLFPDYTNERTLKCIDGNWIPSELPVSAQLPPLPSPPVGSNITVSPPPYYVGEDVNYTCPDDQRFPDGRQYMTTRRTETGWTEFDPTYICLNVCTEDPQPPYGNITYNYTGVGLWNQVIEYQCYGYFHGGGATRYNQCKEPGYWDMFFLPHCINVGEFWSVSSYFVLRKVAN